MSQVQHSPSSSLWNSGLRWWWLAMVAIVLDQISKWLTVTYLDFGYPGVSVAPFVNLVHVYKPGAAFSFLANEAGWQCWFFAVIALAVSAVLVVWLKRLKTNETWLAIAFALVLGGAIGNLYDRVVLGHVVDFILVHWKTQWYFPAFNIADSAITLGAVMLALDMFRGGKSTTSKVTGAQDNE